MCTAVVPLIPSSARLSALSPYWRAFSGRACIQGSSTCTTSAPPPPAAPRREQVADFLVDRDGVVHRRLFAVLVVQVLRLLAHGEGARHGDLGLFFRMPLEKQQVFHLDRMLAPDPADDAGYLDGVSGAVAGGARAIGVHAFQRGGKAV